MRIRVIGRLHFLVASKSRDIEHLVDLEPQDDDPYFCACERFNESPHYRGEPCHHIEAVVKSLTRKNHNHDA